MFKVIANLDDPSQTRSFDNYVDIFNPIKNEHSWPCNFLQLINALKVLWTPDNIYAHPEFFFTIIDPETGRAPSATDPDYIAFLKKLLKPIPEERYWLLHWFYFRKINEDNKLVYVTHSFNDCRVLSRNRFHFYCNPGYYTNSQYSYRGDNYPTEINTLLDKQEERIKIVLAFQNSDISLHPDVGIPSHANSALSYRYQSFLTNSTIASTTELGSITTTMLRDYLRSDPSAIFDDQGPRHFSFIVRSVITKQNKSALYRQYSYSTSPLAILQWPLVAKGEHNPMLYGVELELATDYQVKHLIDATDEPFFLCKQDSSITGNKPYHYELATVPMSFKAHKKQWAFWFSNLDYDKFDTTKDTNNGMHVHIGRQSFADPTHLKNFIWFFTQPAHIDFMKFYSMRDNYSFSNYAAIPNPPQNFSRVRAFSSQQNRIIDMRGCVHLSAKNTVEIRLFRGLVSLADIIKNLEFVDSVFHYTMQGQNFTKMSLNEYLKWLHAQPRNKYTIIKKYLENTPKLKKLIDGAALLELIFTEKDPSKILKIVEKAKFPVTNAHVSILNQRWKKRILVLKDGKLIFNPENITISTLDRLLEQRILGRLKKGQPPPPPTPTIQPSEDDIFDEPDFYPGDDDDSEDELRV